MKKVTASDVMSWGPCNPPYTREYVEQLFAGRETIDALDVLAMDIPYDDMLWAVLREDMLSERTLRLAAATFAASVLDVFEREYPADRRPREAVEAAYLYADEEITASELRGARAACAAACGAWDARDAKGGARAACAAACFAARGAWDAGRDACFAARAAGTAVCAAWDVWDAAGGGRDACFAAGAAELELQIICLDDIIRNEE